MTSENFCYWLQGYFEIGLADKNKGAESLSYQQVEEIRKHLALVLNRITPRISLGDVQAKPDEKFKEWKDLFERNHGVIGPAPTSQYPRPPEIYCATERPPQVDCSSKEKP